jgi:ABC-type dipeptide/oligopeptide/nickel transport system permease component
MKRYAARRALHAVPVLFGVTLISFLLVHAIPGDPIRTMLQLHATPDAIAYWRKFYGLDLPLPIQYLDFLGRLATLDLGQSIQLRQPVNGVILQRLGPTLALVAYSVLLSLLITFVLATVSALTVGRWPDRAVKIISMTTNAMPAFWVGVTLIGIFCLQLDLFPASGLREGMLPFIWSLTLPAVTVALYVSPVLIRGLRSTMIGLLHADFVDSARARGLAESTILVRYVLRNSLVTLVTMVGLNVGFLIGGTIVVENVFAISGIGQLIVNAVTSQDFPVVQACVLLIGVWVVAVNLLTDLLNAALDPRIRL